MTIFVSIASYRDPELIPTLRDCIAKANWPALLRIGVCWQHDDNEIVPPDFIDQVRVRRLEVPYPHSKGACWARSRIQRELFDGEDFYLQIDSHHRFVQDWDAILLNQFHQTGADKPILSTYVAAYDLDKPLPTATTPFPVEDPNNPGHGWQATVRPCMMRLDKIEPTGVVLFQAFPVSWAQGKPPVKARFVSGHFLFAPGCFVEEVPYDPELYFTGEEMSMAIRAYTHGYDLFHPSEHVLWHEYTRKARTKHWDDHTDEKRALLPPADRPLPWYLRDVASKQKVLNLLMGQDVGPFGLGTVRSLQDYEAYSGLDFTRWTATPEAFKGDPPV